KQTKWEIYPDAIDVEPGQNAMKILYACSFPIFQEGGKGRATRQKITALRENVSRLYVIEPGNVKSLFGKIAAFAMVELKALSHLLSQRKRIEAYISRGYIGTLSIPIARLRGILTVREVHAIAWEEANIISSSIPMRIILRMAGFVSDRLDQAAEMRIFNN